MKPAALALMLITVGVPAAKTSAFATPESFAKDVEKAGGGGRYFTGSITDQFTCAVCHQGGTEKTIYVRGLPENGYTPGKVYTIELVWTAADNASLNLEFAARGTGASTGKIAFNPEVANEDRCGQSPSGDRAAKLLDVPPNRQIVTIGNCGASRIRLDWTAPASTEPFPWIEGAVVWADGTGTPEKDAVTSIEKPLVPRGYPADAVRAEAGCSVTSTAAPDAIPMLFLSVYFGRALRRRRRAA